MGAPPSPFDEADALWMASKFTESNSVLENILASGRKKSSDGPLRSDAYTAPSDPRENAEALWRMARNYYDIGETLPKSAKGERYTIALAMEDYGRRCMKADPQNGHCYLWTGTGLGRQGTVRGLLTQARHAKEIRDLWEKAARMLKPYRSPDGTYSVPGDAYFCLGIFYRLVPTWEISQLFLGVKGDLNKSVDCLRTAIGMEPLKLEYAKELGASLICRGLTMKRPQDIEEGKAYLMKTQSMPVFKGRDRVDQEHARLILSNPEMACAYSRDGQQEISEKEARKLIKNFPPVH